MDNGKFLLAARKVRRAANADYIISLNSDDMSRCSNTYVGKLRLNLQTFKSLCCLLSIYSSERFTNVLKEKL